MGACHAVTIIQGYTFCMESMPFEHRNLISTLTSMTDKIVLTITTLCLKFRASNWLHIVAPGVFFTALASVISFILEDSP